MLASKRAPGALDRRPVARRILTAGFTAATRRLLGLNVTDAHGIKAMDRDRRRAAHRADRAAWQPLRR